MQDKCRPGEHGKTVLVTGGAGYIGSHACKVLAQAGYVPVAYDNLSRGHAHAVKWGPLIRGDILDPEALGSAFAIYNPVAVLHFAALAYVGESTKQPMMYYRTNVSGTLVLLDVMTEHGCGLIVFSSTCAIYGNSRTSMISESHRRRPINPYGHSKCIVEQILLDCDRTVALRSVSLRYFNAAGADPNGEIGEEHQPETHVVPLLLQAAPQGREKEFEIYGTDYLTADGTAIRDYIHVTDLAEAHLAALRYLEAGGKTVSFNLGSGRGHSVLQLIEACERVTGRTISVRASGRRAGDPPVLVADARRAETVLEWRPRFSLDEIILTAWNWMSKS